MADMTTGILQMTFGEWIVMKRKESGQDAKQCAKRAGMSPSLWSRWENDGRQDNSGDIVEPEVRTVRKIAQGLEVPVQEAMAAAFPDSVPSSARLELDAILQNAANTTGIRFTELKGDYAVQYESDQPPAIVEITEELRRQGEVLTSNAEKLDMVLDYIKAQKEKSQPNSEE